MKRLLTVLGALFLVVGLLAPAYAFEITVYDGKGSGAGWWGAQEYQETSPGTMTGTSWDIGGLFIKNGTQTLYVVTGFNPTIGGDNNPIYPLGDLFIKTTGIPAPLDTTGLGNVVLPGFMFNNQFGTYDYVVGTGTAGSLSGAAAGVAFGLNGASQVYTAQGNAVASSNPWLDMTNTGAVGAAPVVFGALTAADVAAGVGTAAMLALGYQWVSYDLSFLGTNFGNAYVKLTYECGNDDGHGKVPLPPTVLLLGSGLVGLGFLRIRRRRSS